MRKHLLRNWKDKSLKYLEKYLKTANLPLNYEIDLKAYIALQKEKIDRWARNFPNNIVFDLAVRNSIYKRELEPFNLASSYRVGVIITQTNLLKAFVKMNVIARRAENQKVKLWI